MTRQRRNRLSNEARLLSRAQGKPPLAPKTRRQHLANRGISRTIALLPTPALPPRSSHFESSAAAMTIDSAIYDQIRDATRRFADDVIRPVAVELDRSEAFPAEIYREMAELGLFGITVP